MVQVHTIVDVECMHRDGVCWIQYCIACTYLHVPMTMCTSLLYYAYVHFPFVLYLWTFPLCTVPTGTSKIQSCNSSKHNIYLLLIGCSMNANLLSIPVVRVGISSCKNVRPTSPEFYGVSSLHPVFRMLVICSLNNFNLVCHYLCHIDVVCRLYR